MNKVADLGLKITTGIVLMFAVAIQTWFYFVMAVYIYVQLNK